MGKKKEEDLEERLKEDYRRWEHLKEYGGSDPFWDDSVNMNLVRNHIIYHKKQMEEQYGTAYETYPEIYFRELPPKVQEGYMANAAEIREQAVKSFELYLADLNFQYLFLNKGRLSKKEAEKISLLNVLGYAFGLASALKEDNLVVMRRHAGRPESYQESFAGCAQKMKEILSKKEKEQEEIREGSQFSLFQLWIKPGECR